MDTFKRSFLRCFATLALAACTASSVAQTPNVAKIYVGFPAGGTFDVISRVLAEKLQDELQRATIVENRPGGGGRIAVDVLKTAAVDGSAAMLCPDFLSTIYPFAFRKLNYDPVSDVMPVSFVAEFPMALAVPATSPIKTFADFVQWVRANPSKANFGHGAAGGPTYFLGLLIGTALGVPLQDVPFQGAAPMITSLLGENFVAGTSTVGDFAEYHKAGKLRVLAVTSAQRSPLLPDVPTFGELGRDELTSSGAIAICLPSKASRSTQMQWSEAVRRAVDDKRARDKIIALGFVPGGSTPEEARAKFDRLRKFWEPVVKASGFKAD